MIEFGVSILTVGLTIGWAATKFYFESKKQKLDIRLQWRYDAYRGYLRKMDQIYSSLQEDPIGDRERLFASLIEAVTTGREDLPTVMATKMGPFVDKWATANRVLLDEFNEIRLVCESELAELFDEYASMVKRYTNAVIDEMAHIANKTLDELLAEQKDRFSNDIEEMRLIHRRITQIMRKDLGFDVKN